MSEILGPASGRRMLEHSCAPRCNRAGRPSEPLLLFMRSSHDLGAASARNRCRSRTKPVTPSRSSGHRNRASRRIRGSRPLMQTNPLTYARPSVDADVRERPLARPPEDFYRDRQGHDFARAKRDARVRVSSARDLADEPGSGGCVKRADRRWRCERQHVADQHAPRAGGQQLRRRGSASSSGRRLLPEP